MLVKPEILLEVIVALKLVVKSVLILVIMVEIKIEIIGF